MSKDQTLKDLVSERLAAASEEICVLFEVKIEEFKKEIYRLKEENERKQRLLDAVLKLHVNIDRYQSEKSQEQAEANVNEETAEIKVELEQVSIKEEEERPQELPLTVIVKSEDEEALQEEEGCGGAQTDISLESHEDDDEGWEAEADREDYNTVHVTEKGQRLKSTGGLLENSDAIVDHASGCKTKLGFSECGNAFWNKYDLQRHIHTGERRFSCSVCTKSFTKKGSLTMHMRTHTGDKLFSCSVCKKSFSQKSNLKTHTRIHTGEKPFSCIECNATFSLKQSIKDHMKVHTGEKPCKCSVCHKSFKQKSHLRTHMLIHTGDKPFRCSVCDKAFARKTQLKSHMITHTGERAFSCSECNTRFTFKTSLVRHMNCVHMKSIVVNPDS